MADHTNYRDEQFWFTAAVVGFNAVVLDNLSGCFAICAAGLVSILGFHIVLTRWVAPAGRQPSNPPDFKSGEFRQRAKYTMQEIITGCRSLPYILAECSGTLFYLLVIALTFCGVLIKCLH